MRAFLFATLAIASLGCGGNPSGACESHESFTSSCVDVPQRTCEPMVASGRAAFHSGQSCSALGYSVCDANGCRRP